MAELTESEAERRSLTTFVIVGAGPTGVEMAGQIAELTRQTLRRSFRRVDTTKSRILVLDGASAVLAPFGSKLSVAARRELERNGVEVRLGALVADVDANGLEVRYQDGRTERIEASCKV